MEGQKPKIRTMAKDLERVRLGGQKPSSSILAEGGPLRPREKAPSEFRQTKQSNEASLGRQTEGLGIAGPAKSQASKPEEGARGVEKKEEQRLSEILRAARKRMEAPQADPPSLGQKIVAPNEADAPKGDLADILPIESQEGSAPRPGSEEPRKAAELDSATPPYKTEEPAEVPRVAPPPNLPTGEEEIPATSGFARSPGEMQGKQGLAPSGARQGKTPEEILGLPPPAGKDVPAKRASQEKNLRALFEKRTVPPSPVSPERIEAGPKQAQGLVQKGKRRGDGARFALIAGMLVVALLAIGGGIYWNFFLRTPPVAPPPSRPPGPTEPAVPQALMGYDRRETLGIGALTYDALKPRIDSLAQSEFPPDSLVYIPIKLSTETEITYLTFSELLTALQIDAPPPLHTSDYRGFSLFLYSPGEEERGLCAEAGIADASCHGPRLGFVLKLPPSGDPQATAPGDIAFSLMREWEKTIANDLAPLMLTPLSQGAGDAFSLGRYGDLVTHFVNLPISSISVDWILTDEYLIIATSKNAARKAVDTLQ